ncbi:hypothetical protein Gotri_005849 [Gossypium trilobum]|uniref:Sugar phosphate transporter domain-containing protein n=1 Tax=Gossypium trilobum TaxID=34281 RepID=A0A7J9EY08_9ROSI|nr:hypothetical protein [Gossypium trilobum]
MLKNAGFHFPVLLSFIHYVVTLGLVMSLCTGFANVSLKYNRVAKITVTPTIVLAEYLLYKKKVSFSKVVALAVVSIGAAVATVTDLQFNLFGACVALSLIIPSATSKILWSILQQRENWIALAYALFSYTYIIYIGLPWHVHIDLPVAFSYSWNYINTSMILISGVSGFLLQWSVALAC